MTELPKGWEAVRLDEITRLNPKTDAPDHPDTSVTFVPMPSVSEWTGTISDPKIRRFGEVAKGYTRFQSGDVIFAKITPCMENGKIAVVPKATHGPACGSTEFHVLRPYSGVLPELIWRFLRQKSFRDDAAQSMTGAVGQRRVPGDYLAASSFQLPPLPEQRRIVAKIDSLSAKSARARDHLDHIPRLVEKYKQAMLATAYANACRIAPSLATLGSLAREMRNGLSKKPTDDLNGTPILRISAVRSGLVRLEDFRLYPPSETVPEAALLAVGDLLFTRYNGNADYVAVCGMVREIKSRMTYPDKLIRVRLQEYARPKFTELMCRTPQARSWLSSYIKSAAGQHGISGADLKLLPLPCPSVAEQDEIVRRIETAFAWIDRLATQSTTARKLVEHLDQAVLAKAFRGELVPQDPADEPASVLLERIRAERVAAPAKKRGRRPKVSA